MLTPLFTKMAVGGEEFVNASIDKMGTAILFCIFLTVNAFHVKRRKNGKMDQEKTGLIGILLIFILHLQIQKKTTIYAHIHTHTYTPT